MPIASPRFSPVLLKSAQDAGPPNLLPSPPGPADEGAAPAGTKSYVLRNALPEVLREAAVPARTNHRALSMVVLALLHLDGGKMEEGGWRWGREANPQI